MLASMLPDLDTRVVAELVVPPSASMRPASQDAWGHSPRARRRIGLPASMTGRRSAEDTLRRDGGRRAPARPRMRKMARTGAEANRNSAVDGGAAARGPPKPPPALEAGRHARRLRRRHARQQNVVDEKQANAIKDLLVLGDHDVRAAPGGTDPLALVESNMTDSKAVFVELRQKRWLGDDLTQGSCDAALGGGLPPRQPGYVRQPEFEHLMDLDAGLSGVPVVFDGPSPRRRTGSAGARPDGAEPAFAMDLRTGRRRRPTSVPSLGRLGRRWWILLLKGRSGPRRSATHRVVVVVREQHA